MLALLLLTACGVRLPEPVLLAVSPDRGWNGEETVIAIDGQHFLPQVQVNANRRDAADLDVGFLGWLDSAEHGRFVLSGVSAADYSRLTAVVRPGLPVGTYDLLIEGPTGSRASLPDAFQVSDTRADRLTLAASSIIWTVNEQALLDVQLADPRGDPVLIDLEVELRVRGLTRPASPTFGVGLGGQVTDEDGLGIRGTLGPDGRALVPLVVAEPDTVEVTVAPVDPDSVVRPGAIQLLWRAGDVSSLDIALPGPAFEVDAGTPFLVEVRPLDGFGNVVADATSTVLLRTACGDWTTAIALQGPRTVEVVATASTEHENCAAQRIESLSGVPGSSPSFSVRAGDAVALQVQAAPAVVRAGRELNAVVSPRDAWGNRTLHAQPVALEDTVGGVRGVDCVPFTVDDRLCRVVGIVAAPSVQLIATSGALTGTSAPYRVLPSDEVGELRVEPLGSAVAGSPFPVAVHALDAFGNTIPLGDLGTPVSVDDDLGEADCVLLGSLPDDRLAFDCALFTARAAATLLASSAGVAASSPGFEVVNGPLAWATVDAPAEVIAGVPFDAVVRGFDAFGNPHVQPPQVAVDLGVELGGAIAVAFDADGEVTASVALERAGQAVLRVWSAGVEIGASEPIGVVAGPAASLAVEPSAPWIQVGAPLAVRVTALDAWGNRADSDAAVSVSSRSGAAPSGPATLVQGIGSAELVWSSGVLDEVIDAAGEGLSGASRALHVIADCGASGPAIAVDFGGEAEGRACFDPVSGATVAASFAGSVAGANPIVDHAVSVEGGEPVGSMTPGVTVSLDRIGESALAALVVDAAACGQVAYTSAWAGPNDGSPVGRLTLDVAQPSIFVGSGETRIDVRGAVDCTGDPPAGASLRVRADRGDVLDATPTGSGLEIELNGAGDASFTLDATGVTSGGIAALRVASPSGGSRGGTSVVLVGDDRAPTVWTQAPAGATTGLVETLSLRFDEPLLPASVTVGAFALSGPSPLGITSVELVEPDRVALTPSAPIDATAGAWTLTATDALRDLAGNRLDGASSGGASAWVGGFGAVGAPVDGVACVVSPSRFRPDGDPGAGEEADAVVLSLDSASAPHRWLVSVRDTSGELIARERALPAAPSDSWRWDGRDVGERVVDDGSYTISVEPEDAFGNRGAGCSVVVHVDNGGVP